MADIFWRENFLNDAINLYKPNLTYIQNGCHFWRENFLNDAIDLYKPNLTYIQNGCHFLRENLTMMQCLNLSIALYISYIFIH